MSSNPQLIEPNAKYYLFDTLKTCHETRTTIYFYALNIGIFLFFAGIAGYTLYYCHKMKLSDYDKEQKMIRDQQYIVSKIRFYQEENKKQNRSNVTNLPFV
jgi:hypothetical protein